MNKPIFWTFIGLMGQGLFFMRFLIQWWVSEKKKKSVIPHAFWYFSIAGGAVLLIYAMYRQDPVFIIGQSIGLIVYFRNLHFVRHEISGGGA